MSEIGNGFLVQDLPDHIHEIYMKKIIEFKKFFFSDSPLEMDMALNAMCSILAMTAYTEFEESEQFIDKLYGLLHSNLKIVRLAAKQETE